MDRPALLAIDTSTEICSVAVCFPFSFHEPFITPAEGTHSLVEPQAIVFDDRSAGRRVITIEHHTGSVSSGVILPAIDAVLRAAGMRLQDCGALAFGAGPGSFTGLRTATGIAQGLAFGANLQVIPVNTLMACAESSRQSGVLGDCSRVVAVMDARMSQCYWEAFDGSAADGVWRSLAPSAVTDPEAVHWPMGWQADVGSVSDATVHKYAVVGNGAAVFGDRLSVVTEAACVDAQARPSARAIAAVGWRDWQAGLAVAPADALPRYVRDKVASTTLEREAERIHRTAHRTEQAGQSQEVKS